MPNAKTQSVRQDKMIVENVVNLSWKPKETLPPGASSTNVYGIPSEGDYAFYGKFPQDYTVPIHWHTNDVWVVIAKGSMIIRRDGLRDSTIKQGGFFFLPGLMQYIAQCTEECIFLAYGFKPFDIFYRNPKDDPRNKSRS
jgi:hypothetical protein